MRLFSYSHVQMKKGILLGSTIVLILTFLVCMIVFHSIYPPLEKIHADILKLFPVLERICKDHNLSYWIEAGTLLGAVRNQSIIPWDDDADIGMLEADCQRLLDIDLSSYGVELQVHSNTEDGNPALLQFSFPGQNHLAWIDIFPRRLEGDYYVLVGWPKEKWPNSKFEKICYDGHTTYKLNGLSVRGPKRAEAYLENYYGGDWRTPKATHIHTFSGFRGHPVYLPFMVATPLLLTGALIYSIMCKS